jgi:hypothetical protein
MFTLLIVILSYVLTVYICWLMVRSMYIRDKDGVDEFELFVMFIPILNVVIISIFYIGTIPNWKDRFFKTK